MARSSARTDNEAAKAKRQYFNATAVLDTADQLEHLDALALRLGVSRSEITKAFVLSGLKQNPVSEEEREAVRNRGDEAPVKRPAVEAGPDGKLILMMVEKKRRWRDSNPR